MIESDICSLALQEIRVMRLKNSLITVMCADFCVCVVLISYKLDQKRISAL